MTCHSKTNISMRTYISSMPVNFRFKILPKVEVVFFLSWFFSLLLPQMDDFKLNKRYDLIFPIVNFDFFSKNIPSAPSCGVAYLMCTLRSCMLTIVSIWFTYILSCWSFFLFKVSICLQQLSWQKANTNRLLRKITLKRCRLIILIKETICKFWHFFPCLILSFHDIIYIMVSNVKDNNYYLLFAFRF